MLCYPFLKDRQHYFFNTYIHLTVELKRTFLECVFLRFALILDIEIAQEIHSHPYNEKKLDDLLKS